jgi:hypothetical protein
MDRDMGNVGARLAACKKKLVLGVIPFLHPSRFSSKMSSKPFKKNSFKAKKHFQEKNHFKKIIQRKRFKN